MPFSRALALKGIEFKTPILFSFDENRYTLWNIKIYDHSNKAKDVKHVKPRNCSIQQASFDFSVVFCKQIKHIPTLTRAPVMVIVVGNGHGDTSSNPGRGWLHFT